MSDLQLGLLGIGALVVVAVLAYNKWQEIRYRRLAQHSFGSGHVDVLLLDGNPGDDHGAPQPAASPVPAEAGRVEPTLAGAEPLPAQSQAVPGGPVLDEAIDYIIEFSAASVISAAAVIELGVKFLAGFGKPVDLEGYDDIAQTWVPLTHEQGHTRMRAGLQLVDRSGMVSAQELARFTQAVQELAAAVGACATAADSASAAQRAQDLDKFCAEVDIQIALNLVPASGLFAGTKLRTLAESAGFALEKDGRFRRRDEQGRELFTLSNAGEAPFAQESLRTLETAGVMFEFDVPRAPGGTATLGQLGGIAGQFAAALGGRLVDDDRAELGQTAFAAIVAQLQPVYAAMSRQGIPAGSPLALRLFS